jgi:N-acetyl-alpha-D-glucosaminyl L-malate synthase BshA
MARREDLPIITTLHGTDITIVGNDPSYLTVTRFSVEVSDRVTTVSQWLTRRVNEVVGCECATDVVYNFVDPEQFRPRKTDLGRRLHAGGEQPVLMHLSNFRPVKRIEDVVEIFLRIRDRMPARLVMVGDGPERPMAEKRLERSPYRGDVQFFGTQDHAEEIFPAADLFLFPSNAESFGLAALEALACGVPVIGANAGGLTEVVEDGVSGRLLPPGDAEAMAQAAIDILTDRGRFTEMSRAARQRAVDHFRPEMAIDRYEKIYWEALEEIHLHGPRDRTSTLTSLDDASGIRHQ